MDHPDAENASHNGAEENLPQKLVSFAPFGLKSVLPLPRGRAWQTSANGSEEEAGIEISVQSLGSYLTRIRRKEPADPVAPAVLSAPKTYTARASPA